MEDSAFRLKFLRAKRFDSRQAIHQMMNFLEQEAVYFGEEKVAYIITPSDLYDEEIQLIRSGFFQIMAGRDRRGRVIVFDSVKRIPNQIKIGTMVSLRVT